VTSRRLVCLEFVQATLPCGSSGWPQWSARVSGQAHVFHVATPGQAGGCELIGKRLELGGVAQPVPIA